MAISKDYNFKQIVLDGEFNSDANWTPNLFDINIYGPINYIKSIRISIPSEQRVKIILDNMPKDQVPENTPYIIIGDRGFELEVDEKLQLSNLNVDTASFSGKLLIDLVTYDLLEEEAEAVVYDGGEIGG